MEYTVAAVQEALSVLMVVAHNAGHGVTEIARRSGNTKARTFRLLSTLEQAGFVQRERDSTTYVLGHGALFVGLAAQVQLSLVRLAGRHLEALGRRFNENAHLLVRHGLESVNIARWDCAHDLRVENDLGRRRPLHAGASAKLLLTFAPPEVREAVIGGPLQRYTTATLSAKVKLRKEMARIRQDRWSYSKGEVSPGVVALAAPVYDASEEVVAAIGFSMPASREPKDLKKHLAALSRAARELSMELGANPETLPHSPSRTAVAERG